MMRAASASLLHCENVVNASSPTERAPTLRKVGGPVMLAVSPAILDLLHLRAGSAVSMAVEYGRLVIEPKARPRYIMAELLAPSDCSQAPPSGE